MSKLKSLLILSLLWNISVGVPLYPQSLQERMDQTIPSLLEQNNVPGLAIAIIENNEIVLKKGYGFSDVENNITVTPATGFNIGSISKMITAWGVIKLVESGKVNLDNSVEKYITRWSIPESEFNENKVTIRSLLNHTAGLSVHGYPGFPPELPLPTLEESLNGINGPVRDDELVELIHEPNTIFKYSGGGYTILQLLIEEVSGSSFSNYMQKTVFEPLGMNNTSFTISKDILGNSATPYDETGKLIYLERFTAQAAAGLHTTLDDLILFSEENLQPSKILSPEYFELMTTPSMITGKRYGLGYMMLNMGEIKLTGHAGSNTGWQSALFFHPSSNSAIIMLTNGSSGERVLRNALREWSIWKTSQNVEE